MEDETKTNKGPKRGRKTFLSKKVDILDEDRQTEAFKSKPFFDNNLNVVFVNGSKYRRAQEIVALITGAKAPVKSEDLERKEHYSRQLEAHGVDPNSDEAVAAVYEILGGLIRTPSEQKDAEAQVEEMRKRGRKKMIE